MRRPVYVLGAGFSKAIHQTMPVTDQLGNEVLNRDESLRSSVGGAQFSGGSFESWLSRRAEDQPYLNASQNYQSRAIYARAVELVAAVLQESEAEAMQKPCPPWLLHLLQIWHAESATVITFNYDTLVESAISEAALYDPENNIRTPWATAINFTPPGADRTLGEDAQNVTWATFRLLKMHGSLNWYWSPGDSTGATITRARLPGKYGSPRPIEHDERVRWLPGREPFLVPPAASKSPFYANPVTQEIWRQAFAGLQNASRLTLMGYSVPFSDLSVAGMLAEALRGQAGLDVDVVDLNPAPVRERIEGLTGSTALSVKEFAGPDAITSYVGSRWSALLTNGRASLVSTLSDPEMPDYPVAVAWHEGAMAAAIGIEDGLDESVVRLEGVGQIWFATRRDRSTNIDVAGHTNVPVLTSRDLAARLTESGHLSVRTFDGAELPVIGSIVSDFEGRNGGTGKWLLLLCAGGEDAPSPNDA